ncbi:anthranilate/para-aminobenzoate synthase component I [Spirochaeta africana DSM 8902]|uniref:Anthranilate/para-aminobenzoate synthase component I n=2 Tax=Spirochaeta TaxID=146 RepID=H9UKN0_SPIAZ|nr:anthranilate/para-aminobenzoate synthase component I [Spirochaeta africana DSM 8902]
MNRLGGAGTPFICLLDVENSHPRVLPIDSLNTAEISFATPLGEFPAAQHRTPIHIDPCSASSAAAADAALLTVHRPVCRQRYQSGFQVIRHGLLRGDSFLANLTYPVEIATPVSLYHIHRVAHARYRLWWRDHFTVFSPETFVTITPDGEIATFPMKGTIAADLPDAARQLMENPKEAAEHLTVVDLLRNDLGRIGRRVRVERYRYLDRIHSPAGDILQASSEIRAELGSGWRARIGDLLQELLPAGSITGAPKCRTMELIAEAEGEPRGYYTGVFGHFDGQQFCSGVMIRFIEQRPGGLPDASMLPGLRFRAGGGITIYSQEDEEYAELHTKVRIPVR